MVCFSFKKTKDVIGFRHWLLILLTIAAIHALVVYQDNRMPNVVEKGNYDVFSEERARLFLHKITSLGARPSGSKACEVILQFCSL